MSERIATIISGDGVITLILDGKNYLIDKTHQNYLMIKEALVERNADTLAKLVDIPSAIVEYAKGKVEVTDGEIIYDGEPVHNTLADRILNLMAENFPFDGMIKFLENLMENPSARAVNELYDFLENKGLPITEDGHFLAYKGIRRDWLDKWSGTINNRVGQVVKEKRNKVDDNRAHECSFGLHCGALEYVRKYCTERVIIVKVNPKHVVSVPRDHQAQKVRVCEYEVLREYTGEIENILPRPMYQSDGEEIPSPEDEDYYAQYELDEEGPCYECEDECDECEYFKYHKE